jgi:hypothetical protein
VEARLRRTLQGQGPSGFCRRFKRDHGISFPGKWRSGHHADSRPLPKDSTEWPAGTGFSDDLKTRRGCSHGKVTLTSNCKTVARAHVESRNILRGHDVLDDHSSHGIGKANFFRCRMGDRIQNDTQGFFDGAHRMTCRSFKAL